MINGTDKKGNSRIVSSEFREVLFTDDAAQHDQVVAVVPRNGNLVCAYKCELQKIIAALEKEDCEVSLVVNSLTYLSDLGLVILYNKANDKNFPEQASAQAWTENDTQQVKSFIRETRTAFGSKYRFDDAMENDDADVLTQIVGELRIGEYRFNPYVTRVVNATEKDQSVYQKIRNVNNHLLVLSSIVPAIFAHFNEYTYVPYNSINNGISLLEGIFLRDASAKTNDDADFKNKVNKCALQLIKGQYFCDCFFSKVPFDKHGSVMDAVFSSVGDKITDDQKREVRNNLRNYIIDRINSFYGEQKLLFVKCNNFEQVFGEQLFQLIFSKPLRYRELLNSLEKPDNAAFKKEKEVWKGFNQLWRKNLSNWQCLFNNFNSSDNHDFLELLNIQEGIWEGDVVKNIKALTTMRGGSGNVIDALQKVMPEVCFRYVLFLMKLSSLTGDNKRSILSDDACIQLNAMLDKLPLIDLVKIFCVVDEATDKEKELVLGFQAGCGCAISKGIIKMFGDDSLWKAEAVDAFWRSFPDQNDPKVIAYLFDHVFFYKDIKKETFLGALFRSGSDALLTKFFVGVCSDSTRSDVNKRKSMRFVHSWPSILQMLVTRSQTKKADVSFDSLLGYLDMEIARIIENSATGKESFDRLNASLRTIEAAIGGETYKKFIVNSKAKENILNKLQILPKGDQWYFYSEILKKGNALYDLFGVQRGVLFSPDKTNSICTIEHRRNTIEKQTTRSKSVDYPQGVSDRISFSSNDSGDTNASTELTTDSTDTNVSTDASTQLTVNSKLFPIDEEAGSNSKEAKTIIEGKRGSDESKNQIEQNANGSRSNADIFQASAIAGNKNKKSRNSLPAKDVASFTTPTLRRTISSGTQLFAERKNHVETQNDQICGSETVAGKLAFFENLMRTNSMDNIRGDVTNPNSPKKNTNNHTRGNSVNV